MIRDNHKNGIIWKKIIGIILLSAVITVAFTLYHTLIKAYGDISVVIKDGFRFPEWFGVLFVGVLLVVFLAKWAGKEKIFRYRYPIAGVIFILCVLFKVTGSSIGAILPYFGPKEQNTVFGLSRSIRTDEWAVFTPMTWSQYLDPNGPFSYFSSVIRGGNTDVFLLYGQPVATPLMIFKPFLIGYLFLPIAEGMAFFWCGRLIALFMASFEFGRMISKDNRKLALGYAFAIAFAPCVQWWFAINGLVEMLFFFQVSLLYFNKYLTTGNIGRRAIYAAVITLCAGGYILTMYPAWMIPLSYVLVGCIVAMIWIRKEEKAIRRITGKDGIIIAGCFLLLAGSLAYVFIQSRATITATMMTEYPGTRKMNGGGVTIPLLNHFSDIWFAMKDEAPYWNQCEAASFLCLFPIGYYLMIRNWIRTRKADPLSIALGISSLFVLIYTAVGLPELIAKLSLMNLSTTNRSYVIVGLANLLLLFREGSKGIENGKIHFSVEQVVIPTLFTAGGMLLVYRENPGYFSTAMIVADVILFLFLSFGTVCAAERVKRIWVIGMILLSFFSGLLVNPVRAGVTDIQTIPALEMVENVVRKDPEAIWAVEGNGYPITNALLLKGARTINSTNVYPDLEKWKLIDEDEKYTGIYNRYAHIQMICTEEEPDEKFRLLGADYFQVYVSRKDMEKLGVKYIFSPTDYTEADGFRLIQTDGYYKIYEII